MFWLTKPEAYGNLGHHYRKFYDDLAHLVTLIILISTENDTLDKAFYGCQAGMNIVLQEITAKVRFSISSMDYVHFLWDLKAHVPKVQYYFKVQ